MDIWLDIPTPIEAVLPRRVFLPLERLLVIGRSPLADIGLPNRLVSRHHCEVGRDGCGAWIRDPGLARAGTYVNEKQIKAGPRHRLLPNDIVSVCDVRIRTGWNFVVDPFWLRWESGVVYSLARRVRDEGDVAANPILADALEEVGCTEIEILRHLRGSGPHVRECWILDALLNRDRVLPAS